MLYFGTYCTVRAWLSIETITPVINASLFRDAWLIVAPLQRNWRTPAQAKEPF